MTTPRVYLGNLGFEHELSGRAVSPQGQQAIAELAAVWVAIANADDEIWSAAPVDPAEFDELVESGLPRPRFLSNPTVSRVSGPSYSNNLAPERRLCPWGWSAQARQFAGRLHLAAVAPEPETVLAVNSRGFSFAWESKLGVGLEGARVLHSPDELIAAIRQTAAGVPWVIKAELASAGRDRLLGRGPDDWQRAMSWARKWPASSRWYYEPWVASLAEAGLQFEVPRRDQGVPMCVGITPLLTDADGAYRGSRFDVHSAKDRDWTAAVEVANRLARETQTHGYFGPLGIDAMLYPDLAGSLRCRPLQDVNARWTMGRLSLGFQRLLDPQERGSWLHVRWPIDRSSAVDEWLSTVRNALPSGARMWRTSPRFLGGQPVRQGTVLLIAPDADTQSVAESVVVAHEAPRRR